MEGITSPPMGQIRSGSIFSPLLISMLGIIGTSISILFYHFFLVRFCMRRNSSSSSALPNTTTTTQTVPPPPTGIDQQALQNIPIYTFSALKKHEKFVECVVCLGELEDEDLIRCLPNCNHVFHVECIDQWLLAHVSCPLCRSKIVNDNEIEIATETLNDVVLSDEIEINDVDVDVDDDDDDDLDLESSGSSNRSSDTVNNTTLGVQSCGLLRHCASLVPGDRRSRSIVAGGLKRSLSMDQSFILQRESGGGELRRSGSGTTGSVSQFDRLLRSFSRLRIGKGNSATTTILPY